MLTVRYATWEQGKLALKRIPSAMKAHPFYNDRPYLERGWPTFETGRPQERTVTAYLAKSARESS